MWNQQAAALWLNEQQHSEVSNMHLKRVCDSVLKTRSSAGEGAELLLKSSKEELGIFSVCSHCPVLLPGTHGRILEVEPRLTM